MDLAASMNIYARLLQPAVRRTSAPELTGVLAGIGKQAAITPAGTQRWVGALGRAVSNQRAAVDEHVTPLVNGIRGQSGSLLRGTLAEHVPGYNRTVLNQPRIRALIARVASRTPAQTGAALPEVAKLTRRVRAVDTRLADASEPLQQVIFNRLGYLPKQHPGGRPTMRPLPVRPEGWA